MRKETIQTKPTLEYRFWVKAQAQSDMCICCWHKDNAVGVQ
jgi:hypothetical protein